MLPVNGGGRFFGCCLVLYIMMVFFKTIMDVSYLFYDNALWMDERDFSAIIQYPSPRTLPFETKPINLGTRKQMLRYASRDFKGGYKGFQITSLILSRNIASTLNQSDLVSVQ